jgi:hypothetical protein
MTQIICGKIHFMILIRKLSFVKNDSCIVNENFTSIIPLFEISSKLFDTFQISYIQSHKYIFFIFFTYLFNVVYSFFCLFFVSASHYD